MNKVKAFLQLIRWPNLLFICLTQFLFFYSVHYSILSAEGKQLFDARQDVFLLLIAASVFIAAAGYIINDYFDVHIDAINKPSKVVVDRHVKRRWAIFFHLLFSGIGLMLSAYVSYRTKSWIIFFSNAGCVILLWFYSTWFKKTLLIGNIVIAALTAWVVGVVYFFAGAKMLHRNWLNEDYPFDVRKLFIYTILYAGFSFVLTLIREAVKDLEDMYGDARLGCKTMPVVWGVTGTKIYIAVWLVVMIGSIGCISFFGIQSGWWLSGLFCLLLIAMPLIVVLKKIKHASSPQHYHSISNRIKLIMLAGIATMLIFSSPVK